MDPYIEASGLWEDFHDDLIGEIKRGLEPALPERYFVQIKERSYVVLAGTDEKEEHPFVPDVSLTTPQPREPSLSGGGKTAVAEATETTAEEVTMRAFVATRFQESFIEIYDPEPELRLVTCIEVLSPSNKRRGTEGWELYLRKRQALLLGSANLVEIDLLRGGQRLPMLDPWPNSPYYLLVCRQSHAPYCRVSLAHFRKPLPTIPVPLRDPDPDIPLALQPMIEAIYARSRYQRRIDYSRPLTPPLGAEDAAWLGVQLRARETAGQSTSG
jgi:hypothetical protein